MDRKELIRRILKEKKERDTLILAHTYQAPEIIDIADISGDSFALSVAAGKQPHKRVILCGVRFMADTVKILSPEKEVILPKKRATCPMAEQMSPQQVRDFRKKHPDTAVIAYINTSTALKAECDACVTSSSALKIVSAFPSRDILFLPDQNLGAFIKSQVKDKSITLWNGCCPTHHSVTVSDVERAKAAHPHAVFAVHPECRPEVVALADYVGSTSGIIDYALRGTDRDVIIGTERGVTDYLKIHYPERGFYQLAPDKLVCNNMKMTTLEDVYRALTGQGGDVIELDEPLRLRAKRSIDAMLQYGG